MSLQSILEMILMSRYQEKNIIVPILQIFVFIVMLYLVYLRFIYQVEPEGTANNYMKHIMSLIGVSSFCITILLIFIKIMDSVVVYEGLYIVILIYFTFSTITVLCVYKSITPKYIDILTIVTLGLSMTQDLVVALIISLLEWNRNKDKNIRI